MTHVIHLRNALFFCVPAAVLMQGCDLPKQDAPFQPMHAEAYETDVLLEYGDGQSANLHLTRCGDALWDAEFTEPAALSGVVLTFDGDKVSANYKGLAFTVPKSALPAKNMLGIATEALDAADAAESLPCAQQEDGSWSYSGECAGGSYTLSFAESGEPLVFDLPAQPLRLTFSGFTVTQQTVETTGTQTDVSAMETASSETVSDTTVTAEATVTTA